MINKNYYQSMGMKELRIWLNKVAHIPLNPAVPGVASITAKAPGLSHRAHIIKATHQLGISRCAPIQIKEN